jgi:type I restriction enzyme S subunit
MKKTSYIEKLLAGTKVEWKKLGEVAQILNGFAFESSKYSSSGIRVIRISDVQKGKMSDKDLKFYPNSAADEIKRYLLREGDLVMSLTGNAGRVAMLSKAELPAALNQRVACIRTEGKAILTRYLFHFFDQVSFENEAMNNATGGGQKNMSTRWLSSYPIPIPPLSVQQEIVRILDRFTELTTELTAELTARKKQYEYYRDKLLTPVEHDGKWLLNGKAVEWKTLGKVAKVQRGASPRPIFKYTTNSFNGIPWIKIGDIPPGTKYVTETKQRITIEGAKQSRILKKGDFILSNSMSFGRPYILDIDGAIHDGWASISDFENVFNSDFLYHYLTTFQVQNYWNSRINSGSVSNLNSDIIKSLPIPIPPISEQERIVSILDKFDALTNSITEGLPREIELRQKQYEYYRDMLLSFPKEEA